MIRSKIKDLIKKSIEKLQKEKIFPLFDISKITIEHPEKEVYGDYATNIALEIAKMVKKNPLETAELINSQFLFFNHCFLQKTQIVKPGFINFFLSQEYLQRQIKEILKKGKKFGAINIGKGKKINIEFCSANPTGPLHLGHGRGAFWGNTLSNVFEKAGYKTTREYFINDYGNQILLLGKSINACYEQMAGEKAKIEENFYKGEYIKNIAQDIFKKHKDRYLKLFEKKRIEIFKNIGLKKMLGNAKKLLKKIGIKFDVWFSEKNLYKKNLVKKTIELLKSKGFVYEKEGALWFQSTKLGDDKDRVLIKVDGETTYFASDVAYHVNKNSRKFYLMIDGFGSDHYGYKARLMAAAKVLGFDKKLKIIIGQFVRLVENGKETKMSKRLGTFVSLEDLINEVGPDVAKFFFLMKSMDTHIDFDLNLAKEQSKKNPVYYVQYAHARIHSILAKLKSQNSKLPSSVAALLRRPGKTTTQSLKLLNHKSELELIKQLIKFPEIIEDTANDYQVQRLTQYLIDTATSFHKFYENCQVLTENKSLLKARLGLIFSVKIVLENGLALLGISTPKKM